MVRGIERRPIFHDDADRLFFLERLGLLLDATDTELLAWALMTNHAHLLLRPRPGNLTPLLRRLLTAHAVRFNKRHQRAGYLFQNRFKSVPCADDAHLMAAIRYINLNPLAGGVVGSLEELLAYPWTGHPAMMGKVRTPGHAVEEALALFGAEERYARARYMEFLREGVAEPQAITLDAPLRSQEEVRAGVARQDALIQAMAARRPTLEEILERVVKSVGVRVEELTGRGKTAGLAAARREFCRQAVWEAAFPASAVARALGVTGGAVSRMLARGRKG